MFVKKPNSFVKKESLIGSMLNKEQSNWTNAPVFVNGMCLLMYPSVKTSIDNFWAFCNQAPNIWCLVYKPVNAGPKHMNFGPSRFQKNLGNQRDFFRWFWGCPGSWVEFCQLCFSFKLRAKSFCTVQLVCVLTTKLLLFGFHQRA